MSLSRLPHPLVLLLGCILAAAALSHLIPAGEYERREDPETGRRIVVAGTFQQVEPAPVGLFQAMVAIPRGMANAAEVIFLVFLIGGAFTVVDETGALRQAVGWLVLRLESRPALAVPLVSIPFATAGALENMLEEIIAIIPVLLILTRRFGFSPLTAVSMSAGAAMVGSSFSPINPFQVGIAQKLAQLPPLSGGLFRLLFLGVALLRWIYWTARLAARTRTAPEETAAFETEAGGWRGPVIIGIVLSTFGVLVYGLLNWSWEFNHLSGLFFLMGIAVGLLGRLGVDGTARAYVTGFRSMAYAAMLIGFARTIYVVLEDGRIVDTVVRGLFTPLAGLPLALSALGMQFSHFALHFLVPSVSGHAVLTMPLLVPLSDLLGLSRQVTVLASQYGAGLCDLVTPTSGALMAILAAGGVRYEEWFRFAAPRVAALLGLGGVAVVAGIVFGL